MFADKLRKSLLQAAIQGQLTEQLPTDGDVRDLLKKIRDEKAKLIAAKKIKAEKPLPPVTDDEIPFELPANWCWCRLGDIINLLSGKDFVPQDYNSNGNGIPYITGASNFIGEEIQINRWTENPSCIAYAGDLLVICKGSSVGKMAIMKNEKAHVARQVMCIHNSSSFAIGFIKIFLQARLSHLRNQKKGIIPGIERKSIQELIIPLPPLAEQERIVERLNALLSEVTELEKDERELDLHVKNFPRKMENSLLQAAIQGQLTEQLPTDGDARELLKKIRDEKAKLIKAKKIKAEKPLPPVTDDEIPFELPANWCWCRLGDIGVFISGYTPKSDELTTDGKIPYFKVADMNTKGNEIWMHKTNLYLKTDSARTYEKNTIVYPKNGGAVLTNKKRILRQDSVVDLNTGGYKVMEPINLMYLFNFFLTINFKLLYKGTALPTLDNKRLQKLLFPLPPLAEQERIVERLNELLPLCEI